MRQDVIDIVKLCIEEENPSILEAVSQDELIQIIELFKKFIPEEFQSFNVRSDKNALIAKIFSVVEKLGIIREAAIQVDALTQAFGYEEEEGVANSNFMFFGHELKPKFIGNEKMEGYLILTRFFHYLGRDAKIEGIDVVEKAVRKLYSSNAKLRLDDGKISNAQSVIKYCIRTQGEQPFWLISLNARGAVLRDMKLTEFFPEYRKEQGWLSATKVAEKLLREKITGFQQSLFLK